MIIGHQNLRQSFSRLIAEKQFPQVALFYGLNGCGKKQVAFEVASVLLCEAPQKSAALLVPCGSCRSCGIFAAGNHPDFFTITPEAPKSKDKSPSRPAGSIKIEQIVELKKKILYPPLMSAHQVIVIDDADLMTGVTTNSLLKLLEEPRRDQIFILVTSRFSRILVTIRSRSAKFFFATLKRSEVDAILSAKLAEAGVAATPETIDFYSECFPGSPALICEALKLPLDPKKLDKILAKDHGFLAVSEMAKDVLASGLSLGLFLQTLRGFCLRRIKAGAKATPTELGLLGKISDAERRLERHISEEFVLENLFL